MGYWAREALTFRDPFAAVLLAALLTAVLWVATSVDELAAGLGAFAVVGVAYLVRNPGSAAAVRQWTGAGLLAWGAAVALLAGGVAATYATGDPPGLSCQRPFVDVCITGFGFAFIGFVGGCFAVALGLGGLARYRRVGAPATDAVDVGPGRAAVSGRIEPAGETLRTVAGDEAVARQRSVRRPRGLLFGLLGEGGGVYWPAERTFEAVPFYVADDTGRVLVVPDGLDGSLADRWWPVTGDDGTRRVDRSPLAALDRVFATDDEPLTVEWTLAPGDEVVVAGVASDAGDDHAGDVAFGADGRVVVGATERERILGTTRKTAVRSTLLGLLFAGGGLAAMLLLA